VRRPALILASLLVTAAAASGAGAKPVLLMPGVTYEKQVQFTLHGPVVVHVLTAPRPGGLWSVQPALSNETIPGTERLTAIERRLSPGATTAGVSADIFAADGRPSGVLMRGGGLEHKPYPSRSSIGFDATGLLHVDRVALLGTVRGTGQGRNLTLINEPAAPNGISLFTPAWGSATPLSPGSLELVLPSFPSATPNVELSATVSQVVGGGGTPIPPGGAVIVARGTAAQKLQAEAPVGQSVVVRLVLSPQWSGMVGAVGGGPVLVRNRKTVFRPAEAFSTDVLALTQPRAAVGQLADGRIVLVSVDGGLPGYSTGLTNYELAQTLVRLGAVTASALGSGAQAGLAFEGKLLSNPSARSGEQPIADALLVSYAGVYAPLPTEPVLSPNGDGVAESEQLSYKIVRPSTVTAQLLGPDGVARQSFTGQLAPAAYPLTFAGKRADGTPELEGTWRWLIGATDDLGRASSTERDFSLDLTLGFPKTIAPALAVPRRSPRVVAAFTLTRAAAVTPRIETTSGVVLRVLAQKRYEPGTVQVAWDGVTKSGATVYSGRYVVHISAKSVLGTSGLTATFTVRRLASTGNLRR
jgi:hypothetical protein